MQKKVFLGATLWDQKDKKEKLDFFVEDGVLKDVLPHNPQTLLTQEEKTDSRNHDFIDCRDTYVLPAGVDMQVHLRVPGQAEKELPETGIKAALYGGYGAVLSMPNTKPTLDTPEALKKAQDEIKSSAEKYGIAALFTSTVSNGLEGKLLTNMRAMAKAGAYALTDDGKGVEPDSFMEEAFRVSAETGLPMLQHAEWPGHGGVLAESAITTKLGLKAYDRKQEWGMVERDIRLLEKYPGARYHVLHVTTRETVELVRKAKEKGLRVTAEASPHHLFFCVDDIDPQNSSFKMNPPLHQKEDRDAIRKALNEGVLDFVATDHAPHEAAAKGLDFQKAAFGTIGMESSLRVLLTGIAEGWLKAERLAEVFSAAPARLLGIDAEFGSLKVGAPFRAVFFEDCNPQVFELKDIQSLSKNSIFLGIPLRGRVVGHATRNAFFGML